jgi:O-antigen/teichoic acid export membrane protein
MTRQMQYRELADINFISGITRLLSTIGSALLGLSYWSFAIGDAASWIVACILTRHKSGHNLRLEINPEVKSEVLSFCLGATGSSFGFYVNANVDNLVVGKMLGSASLGYYNLAYQVTMALSTIFNAVVSQLGMPVFAQINDEQEQEETLFKVVEEMSLIIAPIYALLFLIIDKPLITLVFGSKWTLMSVVIPWLLIFAYFRVINSPLEYMLAAKGRPDLNAKVNIYIAPIAVMSFILGAQYSGILGVSIAVAFVLGIVWTISWWWVGCYKFKWSIKKFLKSCFQTFILVVPSLVISLLFPFIVKPIAFLCFYIISVKMLFPKKFIKYQEIVMKSVSILKEKYIR